MRRDFIAVAKSFPELKEWALDWLKLIRLAYRCNRERLAHLNTQEFAKPDAELRAAIEQMKEEHGCGAIVCPDVASTVPQSAGEPARALNGPDAFSR